MPKVRKKDAPALDSCPLFAGLDARVLADIELRAVRHDYQVGDVILRVGQPAEHVFVLLRGAVRVLLDDPSGLQVTAKLFTAPAFFGEMETLTRTTFIETVDVVRAAHVVAIDSLTLNELLATHAELSRRMLVDVCWRFRTSALNQGYIAFHDVEPRLANLIYSYACALGARVEGGVEIVSEHLSYAALGRGIAATERSVQRVFARWRRLNLVSKRGRYYVVHDMAKLQALAGDQAPVYHHAMRPLF